MWRGLVFVLSFILVLSLLQFSNDLTAQTTIFNSSSFSTTHSNGTIKVDGISVNITDFDRYNLTAIYNYTIKNHDVLRRELNLVDSGSNTTVASPSQTWSGYVVASNFISPQPIVTGVYGSWIVQRVLPTLKDERSSQWAGIGGWNDFFNSSWDHDLTLIQAGTESDSGNNNATYYAWTELLPLPQIPIYNISTLQLAPVRTGDRIIVNVSREGPILSVWNVTVIDITQGWIATGIYPYPSSELAGEFIDERPGYLCLEISCNSNITDFDNSSYGTYYTSQSGTNRVTMNYNTSKALGAWPNQNVTMVKSLNGPPIAIPTGLIDGASFKILEVFGPLDIYDPTPLTQNVIVGQIATVSDSGATGGTGQYSYRWLESKPGAPLSYSNATDCSSPQTKICSFDTTSNTPIGVYSFMLKVTDSVTDNYSTTRPVSVTVKNPPTNITYSGLPTQYLAYVPINITNNQSTATPHGFQQSITVDSSNYAKYEASNLQNVQFTYADGTVIPSWIQSNATNQSTFTTYWLNIAPQIPAYGRLNISMDFANKTTNLFNDYNTGEAPQLSPSYAQYDDGPEIFPVLYDNFKGTALGSMWNETIVGNTVNITVDNGITFTRTNSSYSYQAGSGSIYLYYVGDAAIASDIGLNSSQYLEAQTYNVSGSVGTCTGAPGNGSPFGISELPQDNLSSYGLAYTYMYTSSLACGYYQAEFHGLGISNMTYARGISRTIGGHDYGAVLGMDWVTNTTSYFLNGTAYSPENISTIISNPPSKTYPSIGMMNESIGGEHFLEAGTVWWVRSRDVPPNGVMPNVTFGAVQFPTAAPIASTTQIYGQPDPILVTPQSPTDTVQLLFDGSSLITTTGAINYTFCSGSNVCPTAGIYNITVNDISANQIVYQPLIVFNSPIVSVIPNAISLDSGQRIELSANVTGGTGAFTYQWYNDTSGGGAAILNATTQFLTINSSAVGSFVYKVILTDSGSISTVNSIANVSVRVYPALNASISTSRSMVIKGNYTFIHSNVTGGSGNFTYQWLNVSGVGEVGFPMNGQNSTTFNVLSNTVGTFYYSLLVIDNVTGEQFLTSPLEIDVLNAGLSGLAYLIPITITNNQSTATPVGFQQMITVSPFNVSQYVIYLA